ncbi:AEC family transporter, partial [Candidatus Pelagibacter sp.]|nr:AEC family transporter [Candidatus Pelagibacter sp.]
GIGYYLGKNNPKIDTKFITNFAANIGTPAMILYALTSTGISFDIFKNYFWYFFIAIFLFSLTGIFFLFFLKTKDIIRELPPFVMPNTGNMGLPICLFAYGSQGLGVAAAISALIILSHFTLGVFLADRKFNINVIFKNPPFYAIIVSVIFLYFEIKLPTFIENTTFLLMYATIFLILMSLGIALTRFKVFSFKKALISSIGRVVLGPIIGFSIIQYFNLSGFAAGVLLIQCSMPSAVLNYLVASIYSPKKVVDSVASTIVVSTVMSFITIPIVVFFALKYFN